MGILKKLRSARKETKNTYAFGYPKTKVLAWFVDSKAFFLSPEKIKAVLKSIDF